MSDAESTEKILLDIKKYLKSLSRKATFRALAMAVVLGSAAWSVFGLWGESSDSRPKKPHIALIQIDGAIGPGSRYGDALKIVQSLQDAADNKNVSAILIQANSGGGSPVHAEIVSNAIKEIRLTGKPVIFSVMEVCASACLYIASQADDIYVHANSLVGSVGVKMDSWGLTELMAKLGVQKRSYSKGAHKEFLDPFLPEDEYVVGFVESQILEPLYDEFKTTLIEGRGDRLSDDPRTLTGLVWTGKEATKLGLADGVIDTWSLREKLKKTYNVSEIYPYNKKRVRVRDLLTADFYAEVLSQALLKVQAFNQSQVHM